MYLLITLRLNIINFFLLVLAFQINIIGNDAKSSTSPPSEDKIANFKKIYHRIINDTNNELTITQLMEDMEKLKLPHGNTDVVNVLNKCKVHKRYLTFGKFCEIINNNNPEKNIKSHDEIIKGLFNLYSKGTEFITKIRLYEILNCLDLKIDNQDLDDIFKMANAEGDDRLNFEQFDKWLRFYVEKQFPR
ncbi:uncharacterized protein LOC126905804 isoform X2 [Daktulosphaira vitifoliae]|uniref:uncharacterized protein LOC126905804 isoform X2 n=1 Tax=Daktulosphaira vitifoliae TaxID=58002 RepID=UPI0021AAE561|nr:uncharacterized protein LOC126905804 isoform X2 [Daktulosphaira vitifoliae]